MVLIGLFICMASAQQPTVSDNGVLNAASYIKFGSQGHANAPGSLVSIFGTNLSSGVLLASSIPLSTQLGDVSVTFNGKPAALQFVAQAQINAQIPWEVDTSSGTATVVVKRGSNSSPASQIQVAKVSPGIFTVTNNGQGMAWAINSDGTVAQPPGSISKVNTRPAKVGDGLFIYANGLGPVDKAIADGAAPCKTVNDCTGAVNRNNTTAPTLLIGGVEVHVAFSGLTPQFPGVNQVNFVVPANAPKGNAVSIQLRLNGITTNSNITIAIQ